MKTLALLACLLLAAAAEAQIRPFAFTVTTGASGSASDRPSWTAYYDSGYAERTGGPFGYDGVEQRFGAQGSLGAGLTLLGHVGLGIGDDATRSSQQAELLKDVLGPTASVRLAVGAGARREWDGSSTALARVCLGWSSRRTVLFGNLRIEKPFGVGRDAADLITTLGWLQGIGHRSAPRASRRSVRTSRASGRLRRPKAARSFTRVPPLHWTAPAGRLWVSAGGGPIVYATRSPRSSPAQRPLNAAGNGFTMRVSVGYTF